MPAASIPFIILVFAGFAALMAALAYGLTYTWLGERKPPSHAVHRAMRPAHGAAQEDRRPVV
jgi:hypothetical protein